jgi:hypothetical protein
MAANTYRVRHTAIQIDGQLLLGAGATIVPSTGTQADAYVQTAYSTEVRTTTAPVTDSTGGAAQAAAAAGCGIYNLVIPHAIPAGTSVDEVVTAITIGHKFKILGWTFVTDVPGVGASASRVYNMEIGTTDVGTVPSTCTLTEASTSAKGELTAGTAVSGANTGAANATFSIELATGGTAFTAGSGSFIVKIQNMDTADALAGILANNITQAGLINALVDDIQAIGLAG